MHHYPQGFPELVPPTPVADLLEIDVICKYNLWLTNAALVQWQEYLHEPTIPAHLMYELPENHENYKQVN